MSNIIFRDTDVTHIFMRTIIIILLVHVTVPINTMVPSPSTSKVDIEKSHDNRFLYVVGFKGDPAEVERLLTQNADPNQQDDANAASVLHWAANNNVAEVLLKHGANIHALDRHNHTALYHTWRGELTPDMQYALTKALLSHGANPHHKDNDFKTTALHDSAARHYSGSIQALLEYKADVHAADGAGNTALHSAVIHATEKKVRENPNVIASINLLIDAEANLSAKNKRGASILDYCSSPQLKAIITEAYNKKHPAKIQDQKLKEEEKEAKNIQK